MFGSSNVIYKAARKHYEEGLDTIAQLCKIRFPSDYDNKFDYISGCFEEIIQGIILITIIEDGTVYNKEWDFLRQFENHANVIEHINSRLSDWGRDTWVDKGNLHEISSEKKSELNGIVRDVLKRAAEQLYVSFAEADYAISEVSYLQKIKDSVTGIIESAGLTDGDKPEDDRALGERNAGLKAFHDIIEQYWTGYDEQRKTWAGAFN